MDYPTLSMKPDGESLSMEAENPAVDPPKTDGGYVITRPKYTRKPPRTWSFMYSDLSAADYTALETFFREQAKGSSVAFNWVHPVSGVTILVRFSIGFKLKLDRWGIGTNHRYRSNTISLTEV